MGTQILKADIERSLSVNTSAVTKDRPHIGEATVCAIRTVKDAVEFFDPVSNQPKKVPFTRELLRSAKMAYTSYRQRLDRDKEEKERHLKLYELAKAEKKRLEREREEEDKKKKTSQLDKEKELLKKESDTQGKLVTSEELLKDKNSKLNKAVEKLKVT